MMGSSMMSQQAGPPDSKEAPSRRVEQARVSPCLVPDSETVARRWTWQMVLFITPLLLASTAAYGEGYSMASYQTPPGTQPTFSDSLPLQNSTDGWPRAKRDSQSHSAEGHPGLHSVGGEPSSRNTLANLVGATDQLNQVSGSLEPKVDDQGLPSSTDSPVLQKNKYSSTGLNLATSPSPGAFTEPTGISPKLSLKGFEQSEINMTASSLVLQAVETRVIELANTMDALPTLSQASPSPDIHSCFPLALHTVHQMTLAKETFPNTVSTLDQPASATILTSEKPSISERLTEDLHGPQLSSAQIGHGIVHADGSPIAPTQADILGYGTSISPPTYLKSESPTMLGTSHPDLRSPVGTIPPSITGEGMKFFSSGNVVAIRLSRTSEPHAPANVLTGSPPTQPANRTPKTLFQQMTAFVGWELGSTKKPSATAALPETLSHPSIQQASTHSSEPPVHVTLRDGTLADFTNSGKTRGVSSHWLLEPRSINKSSQHEPVPSAVSPNPSATAGAHASFEDYTESPRRSRAHSGVSPSHGLSPVVALMSSSIQPSMTKSTMQGSQWTNATSQLLSGRTRLPVTKSSTDMTDSSQLAEGTVMLLPHSSAVGMPDLSLSLTTTPLEPDTVAVGTLTKPILLEHQHSVPRQQITSSDSTSLDVTLSYYSTTEEPKDSSVTETMLSIPKVEGSKQALKDEASSVEEEHRGPDEASRHTTVASSTISPGPYLLDAQASSLPPLHTIYPRSDTFGYNVLYTNRTSIGKSEASSLEAITNAASYGELMETGHPARKEETWADAQVISTSSSEFPSIAAGGAPTTELASGLISAEPTAQEQFPWPRQRSGAMWSPPDPTSFASLTRMSKESFELQTRVSAPKMVRPTTVDTATAGSPGLPSRSYLDLAGITEPMGSPPARMEHTELVMGNSTTGMARELFSVTLPERKVALPTPWHATAVPANITEPGSLSVPPGHGSAPTRPTFVDSARSGSPESTFNKHMKYTEDLISRKEWRVYTSNLLSSTLSSEAPRPDLKAATSSTVAATTYRTPFLPSWAPEAHSNISHITMLETVPVPSTAVPVPTRRTFPDGPKSTIRTACSNGACHTREILVSITPPQSTSAQLPATSQQLTRKVLVSTVGSADAKNMTAGFSTKVARPKGTNTTVLLASMTPGTVTEDGHTSKWPVSQFKTSALSQSTGGEDSTPSRPPSPILMLPLRFRLTRIDYTESLGNKSSESYKKVEKEVKLTLNKMLSTYRSFLQINIIRFSNGSVIVESEAVFQGGEGLVPTPSDLIRTIVTEVGERERDSFFEWRVDLKSLWSNGFSLKNLEPERLTVSFTVLGLGSIAAFGGLINSEPLELLRNEVILVLGAQYEVQNFSLVTVGNIQGDLHIRGEAYINTSTHVDIRWALEALRGLANYSVDLSSLSINGSRLSLQVFPFSFLVTNKMVNEELMDRSSVQHKTLARDLSDVLMRILRKYKNLLQVAIREIRGGSLLCHGDVIFQHPAPTSKEILQTLALSVGPKDYLAASSLQVDPFSFTVAGDGLEPPFPNPGIPGYGVALIVLCALALAAFPILVFLPKMLGRKDKIIINRPHDPEAGVEIIELDNPTFYSTIEEGLSKGTYVSTEALD
ncbi:uncharacterized protein LOC128334681 [Hemicordylus capensis]|uniref:uncharacterized protein LOC128334681 n=1 Tax=Hemicordylus capensis TaxID=884348 RepID=UPI002302BB0D|nr:uncharacterized protein LOC128334681 [Hemicordylus capensis]